MTKPKTPAQSVTPDLVRSALSCIPSDVDRDTWVRIAMAMKASDLPGETAFELWNEWSARGASYRESDARATWRSIKAEGSVKLGTLFGLAKDHGFRFPAGDAVAVQTPAPEVAARLAAGKKQARAVEAARYRERADEAARFAAQLWVDASEDAGSAGYLVRKGVGAHGVRLQKDGTLLVPMRDAAGELRNLQRIAAEKPASGPDKRYLAGGRKTGLWHLIGASDGARALLIAEGYATAASLHEATGHPAAVAFDAGNLVHVARALRALHPALPFVICGDDDRETEQRTGTNPGRKSACAAARAIVAEGAPAVGVALPEGLPDGGTDFNDLAAHAGPDAVREQIERATASPSIPKAWRTAKSGAGAAIEAGDDSEDQGADARAAERPDPDRWGFYTDERGVWHAARDRDGERKRPMWLCAPLRVTARTRSDDANGWGYLLEFSDFDGNPKTWAMPSALLSGEGAEWASRLRDMGLDMAIGAAPRNLVGTFINTRGPQERITCTDRVGWHQPAVYVLPSSTIGPEGGRQYVFQSDGSVEDTFRQRGDAGAWRRDIAAVCAGNSRFVFAISCAFAGPLLPFSGLEGGGFHFRGDSRGGKTTALRCAASVYGGANYMQQWRTTSNALESTAVQHNHALLVLDELGQLDPREAGDTAYLLANGMDKNRATRGLLPRKRRTWRLLFLSSGEVGMADLMADAGKRLRAGQEVRMVDVPLDAGAGMGGIEERHAFDSAAELTEALKEAASRSYGTVGLEWLQWCAGGVRELTTKTRDLVELYRSEFVPEAASGQVRTVGSRFALVAAAGELATQAGITGWAKGEAATGARRCFEAWLAARGHIDNGEEAAMLRQVRGFLEKNGEALFTWAHRGMDDHKPNTPYRVGFKRMVDEDGTPLKFDSATEYLERRNSGDGDRVQALVEYLVMPEQWKSEVCKGFDSTALAKLLRARGDLRHEPDRLTIKQRLPGMGKVPVFHVKPSVFVDER